MDEKQYLERSELLNQLIIEHFELERLSKTELLQKAQKSVQLKLNKCNSQITDLGKKIKKYEKKVHK